MLPEDRRYQETKVFAQLREIRVREDVALYCLYQVDGSIVVIFHITEGLSQREAGLSARLISGPCATLERP